MLRYQFWHAADSLIQPGLAVDEVRAQRADDLLREWGA